MDMVLITEASTCLPTVMDIVFLMEVIPGQVAMESINNPIHSLILQVSLPALEKDTLEF